MNKDANKPGKDLSSSKVKELAVRIILAIIIAGFIFFLILEPDDEHDSPKPKSEESTSVEQK